MSVRPVITAPDLSRLIDEALWRERDREFDAWVAREGFEAEALVAAVRLLLTAWQGSGEPLQVLVLGAFSMGWDAHRDLRGESSDEEVT